MPTEPTSPSGAPGAGREEVLTRAWDALRTVYDPEIGLDIVALGLVYDVRFEDDDDLVVEMTLTTVGCPVSESMPNEAADAVANALAGEAYRIEVRLVWDPPWTVDRIDPEAAEAAGLRF